MVTVKNAPVFDKNNFPLNTNDLGDGAVHDAVADNIIGNDVGDTVTITRTRIANIDSKQHGKRKIETETLFSRATTSSDANELKDEVIGTKRGTFAFARDKSGNGGKAYTMTR